MPMKLDFLISNSAISDIGAPNLYCIDRDIWLSNGLSARLGSPSEEMEAPADSKIMRDFRAFQT